MEEKWNDRLEIEGDAREYVDNYGLELDRKEFARELEEAYIDAYYIDWCERHGVTPELVPAGTGTDPEGETVQVWLFA